MGFTFSNTGSKNISHTKINDQSIFYEFFT